MRSRTIRQSGGLPRFFPVGAVYVVEGRGGQYGHLRISARYLIMPGGQRVDVLSKFGRSSRVRTRHRQPQTRQPQGRGLGRTAAARAKKFALVGGTTGQEQRSSYAPGEAPQPLTLNHPASSPGRVSDRGSSFGNHPSTDLHLCLELSGEAPVGAGGVRR